MINKTTCTYSKQSPPPQFHSLKQLILEDYNKIRFITPRIIAMRHPTLSNNLVRAKLTPTDDQFLDMLLHLNNTNTTMHLTAATLPNLNYNFPKITPCRHPTCCTCAHHLLCTPAFKGSHKNADTYFLCHQFSCTTTNIIYLITRIKCRKQYVGHSTQQLIARMNRHRTTIYSPNDPSLLHNILISLTTQYLTSKFNL